MKRNVPLKSLGLLFCLLMQACSTSIVYNSKVEDRSKVKSKDTVLFAGLTQSQISEFQMINPNNLEPCPAVDTDKADLFGPNGKTWKFKRCWGAFSEKKPSYSISNYVGYLGEFFDGSPNGYGVHYFRNGDVYVGQVARKFTSSHDVGKSGFGVLRKKNGDFYLGFWGSYLGRELMSDDFEGEGIFLSHDGFRQEGNWRYGRIIQERNLNLGLMPLDKIPSEKLVLQVLARLKLEKPKSGQKLNLQVSHTEPNPSGDFVIDVKTNSDTASLQINGEEHGGNKDGVYLIKKIARAGQKSDFTIVAVDTNGNIDKKIVTVTRSLPQSISTTNSLNPSQIKRYPERDAVAIIIGIADYKNLPRADYANDDAKVFYDYAIRALGVRPENIKLLVDGDADEVGIYRAFKAWLPGRVRPSTDVYVFYSGHGLPTPDGQGLFLLPQRADRDFIDKTAITQAEVNTAILAAKPKSVTIFLDACYSGQTRTGETLLASARPVSLKADTTAFPDGFTVITASRGDQISSSSPELKHGIFSYYLMRGMEGDADVNRDGKITVGEMQTYLAENVSRQAGMMNRRQEPQVIGDRSRVLVGR
jgi:hypothetical protein